MLKFYSRHLKKKDKLLDALISVQQQNSASMLDNAVGCFLISQLTTIHAEKKMGEILQISLPYFHKMGMFKETPKLLVKLLDFVEHSRCASSNDKVAVNERMRHAVVGEKEMEIHLNQ